MIAALCLACLTGTAALAQQVPSTVRAAAKDLSAGNGRAAVVEDAVVAAVTPKGGGLANRLDAQIRASELLRRFIDGRDERVGSLGSWLPPGMAMSDSPAASLDFASGDAIGSFTDPTLWRLRRRSGHTVLHKDLGTVSTEFRDTLADGLFPAAGGELMIDLTGSAAWIAFGVAPIEDAGDRNLRRQARRDALHESKEHALVALAAVMRGKRVPSKAFPNRRIADLAAKMCDSHSKMRDQLIDDLTGIVGGDGARLAAQLERGDETGLTTLTGEMDDGRWVFTIVVRLVPEGAARRVLQRRINDGNPLGE
ncbi:MAG: hypothetical protein AAGI17_06780 [Planctomycetota bacterium]